MKPLYFVLFVMSALVYASIAFAQADHIGSGGDWSEADLKHFLSRLAPYLNSTDGQKVFPEVAEYDRAHPNETVEKVIADLNPRLVNRSVFDTEGNQRDCVSYRTPVRYFDCNLNSLPRKPSENASEKQRSEYYGSMYRLVLHEVLVQVGLEKSLVKEVPSQYALSSRLMVHLESFPEWVPGAGAHTYYDVKSTDVAIHTRPEFSVSLGAGYTYGYLTEALGGKIRLPVTIGGLEFKVGLTTGYERLEYSNPAFVYWLLPMIGTVEFEFKPILSTRPYFGIGGGSTLVRQTDPWESYSYWNVTAQAVAGVNFGTKDQFFIEIPVPYFNLSWSFLPSLGVHF